MQIPQVITCSPLTKGKTRKCSLVMCPGRRINNFCEQLTSFCQVKRVDEMGKSKDVPTAEFGEAKITQRQKERKRNEPRGVQNNKRTLSDLWRHLVRPSPHV